MSVFFSTRIFKMSNRTWNFITLIYFVPAIADYLDKGDQHLQNVLWFFYLVPTIIVVYNKGAKFGVLTTAIGSIILLITESLQPVGIEKHDIILLIELVIVNILISLAIGVLLQNKKKAIEEIEYIAYHDSLTGLHNMNYVNHYLLNDFNVNKINRIPVSLMFFNIDRFKLINDSYGHQIGDQLLKAVAQKLVELVESNGTVIRAGGDEFILYLPNTGTSQAKEFASLLMYEFSQPIFLENREIRTAASIGISQSSFDDSLDAVIQKASSALNFAKEFGRNQYQFYSMEFGKIANRRLQLEQGLRKAFEHKEMELFYQPKLDLFTNEVTGMEALIRWNDSTLGPISPAEFIPIAEETGMIVALGKWVLEVACKQNSLWQRNGYTPMHVCVNISSRQFLQDDFVDMVEEILGLSGLSPKLLNLEITEGIALYNMNDTIMKLKQLKNLGVSISLDDFGTGYSSLSYLKSLPIDFLKIDRSFISGIFEGQDAAITRSIITLAHSLGLKVVAEGVEEKQQQQLLGEMSCDEIQGYYVSKPLSSAQFEHFLNIFCLASDLSMKEVQKNII